MKLFRNLWGRLVGLFSPPFRGIWIDDLPDRLKSRTVYLIGEAQLPWQAALLCPCGCGATIQLSLIPHDRPRWQVRIESDRRVTLSPSIWRKTGCHAHFFIRNGRVIWAYDRYNCSDQPVS